ncbi:MAG TPA: hypothetical protein PLL20_18065 [Phycisphaerae bacterium]|nr:hypothetical protein [Phycisphaerae bacterium]HRR87050.1 hypothetical protein [Phycisphaerae bacterium]
MHVLVDDRPYTMAGPANQSLAELANEACAANRQDEPRYVVSIRCDGQPLSQEDLAEALESPAERYERVEIQTQPVAALVRSALDQAALVLEDSTIAREKAADLLAAGQHEAAMQELQKFLEAWKQIHQTLMVVSQVLGIDLDSVADDRARLSTVLEVVKSRFAEMKDAMVQNDFVVVGDLLRYELSEPVEQLAGLLRGLGRSARPNPP